jgi:hypothetical protein
MSLYAMSGFNISTPLAAGKAGDQPGFLGLVQHEQARLCQGLQVALQLAKRATQPPGDLLRTPGHARAAQVALGIQHPRQQQELHEVPLLRLGQLKELGVVDEFGVR